MGIKGWNPNPELDPTADEQIRQIYDQALSFDNNWSPEQGDMIYYDGEKWTGLRAGTAGQVLQTGGAGANPSWTTAGGNTLDGAYDQGGAGVGRTIDADTGAVEITVSDTDNNAGLIVNQNDNTNDPDAIQVVNAGQGQGIQINSSSNGPHMNFLGDPTVASPTDGDLWYTGSELNFRDGTRTVDLLAGGTGHNRIIGVEDSKGVGATEVVCCVSKQLEAGELGTTDGIRVKWYFHIQPHAINGSRTYTYVRMGPNGTITDTIMAQQINKLWAGGSGPWYGQCEATWWNEGSASIQKGGYVFYNGAEPSGPTASTGVIAGTISNTVNTTGQVYVSLTARDANGSTSFYGITIEFLNRDT
jgi:hypothetical protein